MLWLGLTGALGVRMGTFIARRNVNVIVISAERLRTDEAQPEIPHGLLVPEGVLPGIVKVSN